MSAVQVSRLHSVMDPNGVRPEGGSFPTVVVVGFVHKVPSHSKPLVAVLVLPSHGWGAS